MATATRLSLITSGFLVACGGPDFADDLAQGRAASNVAWEASIPLRISGPTSRIIVDGEVEGRPVRLLVDPEVRFSRVRRSLARALVQDGRGQLRVAEGTILRVRTLGILGVSVRDEIVHSGPESDAFLDALSMETREAIDGVAGDTFFRHFYVEVDEAASALRLARTPDAPVEDEGTRVGVELRIDGTEIVDGAVLLSRVLPGTDAERAGLSPLDRLFAVDDVSVDGLRGEHVAQMLAGRSGTVRTLTIACDSGEACLNGSTKRRVTVDHDFLRLP